MGILRVDCSAGRGLRPCGLSLGSPSCKLGREPQRAPDGASVNDDRHRLEQSTLYCLVLQHAASLIAQTKASTGAELPHVIKDEFDAFLECGIRVHGYLRLRCGKFNVNNKQHDVN